MSLYTCFHFSYFPVKSAVKKIVHPCNSVKSQKSRLSFQKSSTSHFGAVWKNEIASTTLIIRVKPEADFQTDRSWGHEGDQQPTSSEGRVKGMAALLLRWFTSTRQRVEWLLWEDNCTWRKFSYRNTRNFISKPPSSFANIGWDMKTGKVQVGRRGAALPEGHCTHDNPTLLFKNSFHFVYALPSVACLKR